MKTTKPRARQKFAGEIFLHWIIAGDRHDKVFAVGTGNTLEQAWADFIAYNDADIPF